MEEIQKEVVVPEEEKQQEEELLKETPAEEVRQSIIEKHNLDVDTDSELIDNLASEATELRKQLATAIKQKRNWREKATAKIEPKEEVKPQPPVEPVNAEKLIDEKVNEKLEERELESLDISDELRKDLKTYAKVAGLSIKQAQKSDYFAFKKQKEESAQKAEEASIGGKRGAPSRQDFDANNPPKVDMSSKEGQETWENYRNWLKSQ